MEPQNPTSVEQLIELDILSKDFSSAFRRVQGRSEWSSELALRDLLEAKFYFAQGEWDRAGAALLKALQVDPNYSTWIRQLMSCHEGLSRCSSAGLE